MIFPRVFAVALVVGTALSATGCGDTEQDSAPTSPRASTTSTSTTTGRLSLAAFAAEADAACLRTFVKVNALPDPDGQGGQKKPGLGRVVVSWADELAAIQPPEAVAAKWTKAMGLLRQSGVRLQDAERLAAAGDTDGSNAAQDEALWTLQPQAAEIVAALKAPFQLCFVE